MKFNIKNIDVIVRRNKPQEPCVTDWKNYDEYVMHSMILETGCRPMHWKLTSNFPLCGNATQMKRFMKQPTISMIESLSPPCKSIDRLDYVYSEKDDENKFDM